MLSAGGVTATIAIVPTAPSFRRQDDDGRHPCWKRVGGAEPGGADGVGPVRGGGAVLQCPRQLLGGTLGAAQAGGIDGAPAHVAGGGIVGAGQQQQPPFGGDACGARPGVFARPYADVPALMQKLREGDTSGRWALRFLSLTAARSGEVRNATWEEIDVATETWTVPATRMKAGKVHVVPLSPPALKVLRAAAKGRKGIAGEPIFPGPSGKALSDLTLGKVLRTAVGGQWTVHGMRSAFRDWAADETDHPGEIAETALAHVNPNKSYRRTDYFNKRRNMMAEWATFIDLPDAAAGVEQVAS